MFDDILDFFADIPDHIMELPSTIAEFFGSMFEDIGELSFYGLAFGVLTLMVTIFTKKWTLDPFLSHMSGFSALFWMVATYASCFVGGYLLGRHFENS